jgi:hypothetical protein
MKYEEIPVKGFPPESKANDFDEVVCLHHTRSDAYWETKERFIEWLSESAERAYGHADFVDDDMIEYDYCHFEICKGTDQELSNQEIHAIRKDVQRLVDETVQQYKVAKDMAEKRAQAEWAKSDFERSIQKIKSIPEGERTINQVATLKEYEDGVWEEKFSYSYDYDDDMFTDWGDNE